MKLCRFQPQTVPPEKVGATEHPKVLQGVISGETVREVSGEIFGKWTVTNRSWPLTDVKLLPPVVPSKIVCLGRNYLDHAAEFNNLPPKEPLIFLKPPSSLLAPEDPIVLPPNVQRVDYEGELAVIISRNAPNCAMATMSGPTSPDTRASTTLARAITKPWTSSGPGPRALTRFARWVRCSKLNLTLLRDTSRPC